MSVGLVLEGGAMRGLFTAGVIDEFLENGIQFDKAAGVSAGAVFGSNIKSGQIGRVLRCNLNYVRDPRYRSFTSWILTGNFFGADFCYNKIPYGLDPFDFKAFQANPMDFYCVCTSLITGKPVYHLLQKGTREDMEWIRASASMPFASKMVKIGDEILLDGTVSDPLPVRFIEGLGVDKTVVVRTKPPEYRSMPLKSQAFSRIIYRKYPKFVDALDRLADVYNSEVDYINQGVKEGRILSIQPYETVPAGLIEKNRKRIQSTYNMGREVAVKQLDDIKHFIAA